jgi:hypothetical protein
MAKPRVDVVQSRSASPSPNSSRKRPDGTKAVTENTLWFSPVAIGTIVWPNDVDFDPEVLYSHITGQPIPGPDREGDQVPLSSKGT